jgi:hypothetical protein
MAEVGSLADASLEQLQLQLQTCASRLSLLACMLLTALQVRAAVEGCESANQRSSKQPQPAASGGAGRLAGGNRLDEVGAVCDGELVVRDVRQGLDRHEAARGQAGRSVRSAAAQRHRTGLLQHAGRLYQCASRGKHSTRHMRCDASGRD